MIKTLSLNDSMWLQSGIKLLNHDGVFVLDKVLNPAVCDRLISAAEEAYAHLASEIGLDRLQRAGESGVVRFPLRFHDDFSVLLGNPQVFDCVVIEKSAGTSRCIRFNLRFRRLNECVEQLLERLSTFVG